MDKIATTAELQHELQRLLEYAQGYRPSRVKLAEALTSLSERVAATRIATEFPNQKALETYLKKHPKSDKSKHSVTRTEAEHQKSDEYKTSKDPNYYPKKAPAGMKYPSELSSLGALKADVMSMFEEDLDKDRAYRHPDVKKLQKSLAKRFKTDEGGDEVLAEMRQLEALKGKMSEKMRDAKSDAEADPYRFAMRKIYHAWQGYNAALQDNQERGNRK